MVEVILQRDTFCRRRNLLLLPDHMCEHEKQRHLLRVDVLTFIREHIEAQETHTVGSGDLEFAELLPPRAGKDVENGRRLFG